SHLELRQRFHVAVEIDSLKLSRLDKTPLKGLLAALPRVHPGQNKGTADLQHPGLESALHQSLVVAAIGQPAAGFNIAPDPAFCLVCIEGTAGEIGKVMVRDSQYQLAIQLHPQTTCAAHFAHAA